MIRPADEGIEGLTPEEREEYQRLLQQKAARDARIREIEEDRREMERQLREEGLMSDEEVEVTGNEYESIEIDVERMLNRWGYSWDGEQHEFLRRFEEECAIEKEIRTLKIELRERAGRLRRIFQDRRAREEENQREYRMSLYELGRKKQNDEILAHIEEQRRLREEEEERRRKQAEERAQLEFEEQMRRQRQKEQEEYEQQ